MSKILLMFFWVALPLLSYGNPQQDVRSIYENEIKPYVNTELSALDLAIQKYPQAVKYVAKVTNADVHQLDREHKTLLHRLPPRTHPISIKQLIKAGANPDATDVAGNTPLHYQVNPPYLNTDIIKALVESGANTSITNNKGKTAKDLATGHFLAESYEEALKLLEPRSSSSQGPLAREAAKSAASDKKPWHQDQSKIRAVRFVSKCARVLNFDF